MLLSDEELENNPVIYWKIKQYFAAVLLTVVPLFQRLDYLIVYLLKKKPVVTI